MGVLGFIISAKSQGIGLGFSHMPGVVLFASGHRRVMAFRCVSRRHRTVGDVLHHLNSPLERHTWGGDVTLDT
ncbi:hypothetical protein SESBI_23469 [Sesbania bispinosa]|nr:hypothetical protein SESBI_23469 [Sesbania bispinosa]